MKSLESFKEKYQWLKAAKTYERIVDSEKQPDIDRADLSEHIGNCYFHAAMQANSTAIFQRRIRQAIIRYKAASSQAKNNHIQTLRCRAWQEFLRFWLTRDAMVKKRSLHRSFVLVEKALNLAKERDDVANYVRTFDELSFVHGLGFEYETTADKRVKKLQLGIIHSRRVIGLVQENKQRQLLSRNLARLALFIDRQGDESLKLGDRDKLDSEALETWRRAIMFDRNSALRAVGYPPAGFSRILPDEESKQICKDALKIAQVAKDNFSIGWQLDQLAAIEYQTATWGLDPKQQIRVAQHGMLLSERAQEKHRLTNFVTPTNGMVWSGSPYAEWFFGFSLFFSDPAEKRPYLEKAWRETDELCRLAKSSGLPMVMMYAHHVMSSILQHKGEIETDIELKKKFLREALTHRIAFGKINDKIHPDDAWSKATALRYISRIRARLAEYEPRQKSRILILNRAVREKELAARFGANYAKNVSRGQTHWTHDLVGNMYLELGSILDRIYAITGEESALRRSAEACVNGAEWYSDTTDYKTLGLAFWKAAHAYDRLQAFTLAAENFANASKSYMVLSDKPPAILADLYREYSRYLEAWNKIELARIAHRRFDFATGKKLYELIANLHDSLSRWKFLTPYYLALGRLEQAEEESKQGLHIKSVSTLKEAMQLFRQSNISLQGQPVQLERSQERSMVDSLAVGSKDEYCLARIQLEEARISESQGDSHGAVEKYGQAADRFLEISETSPKPYEQKEMAFLSNLSRGLQDITQSIITDQASSLKEASNHFDESIVYAADENQKLLVSAYKYLCLGIISSNQYLETFEQPSYDDASKYFDRSESNFAGLGFQRASAQVRAHKLLIDAQAKIREHHSEQDVRKKGISLEIARTMIRQAAETLAKTHQGANAEKFHRLATNLDELVELSNRIVEVSQSASHDVATTFVFPGSLKGPGEQGIGHATPSEAGVEAVYDVQQISEDHITINLEIVNIGNQSIKLGRINNLVPEKSRLNETPEGSRVEGHSLILKSKILKQLAVETVTLSLRTNRKQIPLVLRPVIVFQDDKGEEHSTRLPVKIMGSSPILDFLTGEFFADYIKKRLSVEHAGWRSMAIVAETVKIPRSQLYGEPRWGRPHGSQLETLIKSGLVESRIFPGERGRGGKVAKIRLAYNNQFVKDYAKTYQESQKQILV